MKIFNKHQSINMAPKKVCYYCDFPHYHLQHATNPFIGQWWSLQKNWLFWQEGLVNFFFQFWYQEMKNAQKIPQSGMCPAPCVLNQCTVVFACLFCLCVQGQWRIYYIYPVEFHFWFGSMEAVCTFWFPPFLRLTSILRSSLFLRPLPGGHWSS